MMQCILNFQIKRIQKLLQNEGAYKSFKLNLWYLVLLYREKMSCSRIPAVEQEDGDREQDHQLRPAGHQDTRPNLLPDVLEQGRPVQR